MHPTLWKAVLASLIVLISMVMTYWILYTRNLKTKQATLNGNGQLRASKEAGIAAATLNKERSGRTGTIT